MPEPDLFRLFPLILQAALGAAVFTAVYHLLRMWDRRPFRRFPRWSAFRSAPDRIRPFLGRCLGVREGSAPLEDRRRLLSGCGLRLDAVDYECVRRAAIVFSSALPTGSFLFPLGNYIPGPNGVMWLYLVSAVALLLALTDRVWLQAWRRQRTYRIVREVYSVSRHLLYYSASRLNLHTKLSRCVPHTDSIRADLLALLNEWYQDPESALRRFRDRLGTEEGHSFVETLLSLRLNDHEAYYELLRDRLRDYKEKIELTKESRKETTSYALFVLAGIPILFTFRVFVYPWVVEGQRLFHSLQ